MPENDEGLIGFVKVFFRGKETPKAPEALTSEQRAQQAFYDAVAKSLTEDKLQSIQEFVPPHSSFDLSKLGDGAVFRVHNNRTEYYEGKNDSEIVASEAYGCVVFDENYKPRLFISYYPNESGYKDQLLFRGLDSPEHLSRQGPEKIKVLEIAFENPELNWDKPLGTFSETFFLHHSTFRLPKNEKAKYAIDVTVYEVDVVSGGKPAKQKAAQPEIPRETAFVPKLLPKT